MAEERATLKQVKRSILRLARLAGGFALARDSHWRRARLLILCYHGVAQRDEHEWNPAFYVTVEHLSARFRLLRDGGYTVLPLGEAITRLRAGSLPGKSVAITFDDGMHDFYSRALPVVQEFAFPVTVYLTTFYSEFQVPVFDLVCSYLLWRGRGRELSLDGILPEGGSVSLVQSAERDRLAKRLYVHVRQAGLSAVEKDGLARDLAWRLGVGYDELVAERLLRVMTPEEVASLPASLVDVQLHTHRHRTPLDARLFRREIVDNRERIAAMRPGRPGATHFCYPSGFHRAELLPWLRELGVESATTCDTRIATRHDDPLALPRLIDTSTLDEVEFEAWCSGARAFLPVRRQPPPIAHLVNERALAPAPAMTPDIAVIIPCHNGARYLERAIASVRRQSVRVERIVVVDDASTDNSASLARQCGAEVIVHDRNRGPAAARNSGLKVVTEKLVAFLDADDYWTPDHLATLCPLMATGADVAFSDTDRTAGSPVRHRDGLPVGAAMRLTDLLLVESVVPQSGALVDRRALEAVGGYDEEFRLAEDFDLWLRLSRGSRFVFSGEKTCVRVIHDEQASRDAPSLVRAAWRARRRFVERLAQADADASGKDAREAALGLAWKHSLSTAQHLGDRALAHDLLALADDPGLRVPGAWRWRLRVGVLWWPTRIAMRFLPSVRSAIGRD